MSYSPISYNGINNTASSYQNGTGSTIVQGAPVSVSTLGQIAPTDVTNLTSVLAFVGYASSAISPSAYGNVTSNGRLQNLTGYSFSVGDAIYIGVGGILQNTKPDYGVTGFAAGDAVVFCGVVVNNTANPSNQDLQILTEVIGVL